MKILKKKLIKLKEKIPVYDIEVDHECHNFCLDINGEGIYVHNSGKTEMEITLAYNQAEIFGTQLIIVPTISIRDQMITERLEKGEILEEMPKIIISAPQSILNDYDNKKHKELLSSFSCLIVDEAHRVGCETWSRLFLSLPNIYRIHGFSAMPISRDSSSRREFITMDDRDAINVSICGDVIYHKTPQDLKEFLNIPILINFTYNWQNYHPNILGTLDWNVLYKRMMENKARNYLIMNIIELLNSLGYNTISYVSRKQQGLNILSNHTTEKTCCWYSNEFHLVENGSIVRKTDKVYNQQNLRDEFGKTKQAIIGSSLLIEGLDFSAPLNALVLTEMKSDRQNLQKIGRIVRPSNRRSIIVNFVDINVKILKSQAQQRARNAVEEFGCSEVTLDSLDKLKLLLNT